MGRLTDPSNYNMQPPVTCIVITDLKNITQLSGTRITIMNFRDLYYDTEKSYITMKKGEPKPTGLHIRLFHLFVPPLGVEPKSSEPESEILSIILRRQIRLQI